MRLGTYLLGACICVAIGSPFVSADVTGKITLDGKAPEMHEIDMSAITECAAQHPDPVTEETVVVGSKGELANVVVSIKADNPASLGGQQKKEPAVLDQKGCVYIPHVLAMQTRQPLIIKNNDSFLHNVHSLAQDNESFNFAQMTTDPGHNVPPPTKKEAIKVKCDVHPWMSAWIVVLDNPFFDVSKPDGTFSIKGLPDGSYTIQAWQEQYGTQEQKVTVQDGKATVNFAFKSDAALAEPVSKIKLASFIKTPGTSSDECDACAEAAEASSISAQASPATTQPAPVKLSQAMAP